MANLVLGSDLDIKVQAYCLAAFVHRYTGRHTPRWVMEENEKRKEKGLDPCPLHFSSDMDWLSHTRFFVKSDGTLDQRYRRCESHCTYPNNPELR